MPRSSSSSANGLRPGWDRPGFASKPAVSATATRPRSKAPLPASPILVFRVHEIAGVIDALGEDTTPWQLGRRVGVGWHGGHCDRCRRGDFVTCRDGSVPGISYDGGHAEYMLAPVDALASIPDELAAVAAAPPLCAGITTYNALRNSGARAGDLVAMLGIGGLGHLAVQFAARMGFRTVAIARGTDKADPARQLGAHDYIGSRAENVAERLTALGGAALVLATVTNAKAMSAVIDGLGVGGKLLVVGATRSRSRSRRSSSSASAARSRAGRRAWPRIPRTRSPSAR